MTSSQPALTSSPFFTWIKYNLLSHVCQDHISTSSVSYETPASYPSPWNISIPFDWHYPVQTTMIRLTSCCFHCAVTLQQQALKRSLISILVLKPLGRYLTPGKSNHALNHSCCMIPDGDFIPQGVCRKTSHTHFFQGSPFRMSFALTMLHSFP